MVAGKTNDILMDLVEKPMDTSDGFSKMFPRMDVLFGYSGFFCNEVEQTQSRKSM